MKGATLVLFCILAIHVLGTLQQQNSGNDKKSEKVLGLESLYASNSEIGPQATKEGKKSSINSSKKKGTKKKRSKRQTTCDAATDLTALEKTEFENMIFALNFEFTTIKNFEQQKIRVKNQVKNIKDKQNKNLKFLEPANCLALALGVNGTDVTNATCGDGGGGCSCGDGGDSGDGCCDATTRDPGPATDLYLELLNCTESVLTACECGDLYNNKVIARYEDCEPLYKAMEVKTIDCKNTPLEILGTCWSDIVDGEMKAIRDSGCSQFSFETANKIADLRTRCLDTFVDCKKLADRAIISSKECSRGKVKSLEEINKLFPEILFETPQLVKYDI